MSATMTVDLKDGAINEMLAEVQRETEITAAQRTRIGERVESALRGSDSEWPRRGGGVSGGASGASRGLFKATLTPKGLEVSNTATGRDRNRALGRKGGGRRRYAQYPEQGIPNRMSAGRATRTIAATLPRILGRVLGNKVDVTTLRTVLDSQARR